MQPFAIPVAAALVLDLGGLSLCFPFFLILALLFASLYAQGKSPMAFFDFTVPRARPMKAYRVRSWEMGRISTALRKQLRSIVGNIAWGGAVWRALTRIPGIKTIAFGRYLIRVVYDEKTGKFYSFRLDRKTGKTERAECDAAGNLIGKYKDSGADVKDLAGIRAAEAEAKGLHKAEFANMKSGNKNAAPQLDSKWHATGKFGGQIGASMRKLADTRGPIEGAVIGMKGKWATLRVGRTKEGYVDRKKLHGDKLKALDGKTAPFRKLWHEWRVKRNERNIALREGAAQKMVVGWFVRRIRVDLRAEKQKSYTETAEKWRGKDKEDAKLKEMTNNPDAKAKRGWGLTQLNFFKSASKEKRESLEKMRDATSEKINVTQLLDDRKKAIQNAANLYQTTSRIPLIGGMGKQYMIGWKEHKAFWGQVKAVRKSMYETQKMSMNPAYAAEQYKTAMLHTQQGIEVVRAERHAAEAQKAIREGGTVIPSTGEIVHARNIAGRKAANEEKISDAAGKMDKNHELVAKYDAMRNKPGLQPHEQASLDSKIDRINRENEKHRRTISGLSRENEFLENVGVGMPQIKMDAPESTNERRNIQRLQEKESGLRVELEGYENAMKMSERDAARMEAEGIKPSPFVRTAILGSIIKATIGSPVEGYHKLKATYHEEGGGLAGVSAAASSFRPLGGYWGDKGSYYSQWKENRLEGKIDESKRGYEETKRGVADLTAEKNALQGIANGGTGWADARRDEIKTLQAQGQTTDSVGASLEKELDAINDVIGRHENPEQIAAAQLKVVNELLGEKEEKNAQYERELERWGRAKEPYDLRKAEEVAANAATARFTILGELNRLYGERGSPDIDEGTRNATGEKIAYLENELQNAQKNFDTGVKVIVGIDPEKGAKWLEGDKMLLGQQKGVLETKLVAAGEEQTGLESEKIELEKRYGADSEQVKQIDAQLLANAQAASALESQIVDTEAKIKKNSEMAEKLEVAPEELDDAKKDMGDLAAGIRETQNMMDKLAEKEKELEERIEKARKAKEIEEIKLVEKEQRKVAEAMVKAQNEMNDLEARMNSKRVEFDTAMGKVKELGVSESFTAPKHEAEAKEQASALEGQATAYSLLAEKALNNNDFDSYQKYMQLSNKASEQAKKLNEMEWGIMEKGETGEKVSSWWKERRAMQAVARGYDPNRTKSFTRTRYEKAAALVKPYHGADASTTYLPVSTAAIPMITMINAATLGSLPLDPVARQKQIDKIKATYEIVQANINVTAAGSQIENIAYPMFLNIKKLGAEQEHLEYMSKAIDAQRKEISEKMLYSGSTQAEGLKLGPVLAAFSDYKEGNLAGGKEELLERLDDEMQLKIRERDKLFASKAAGFPVDDGLISMYDAQIGMLRKNQIELDKLEGAKLDARVGKIAGQWAEMGKKASDYIRDMETGMVLAEKESANLQAQAEEAARRSQAAREEAESLATQFRVEEYLAARGYIQDGLDEIQRAAARIDMLYADLESGKIVDSTWAQEQIAKEKSNIEDARKAIDYGTARISEMPGEVREKAEETIREQAKQGEIDEYMFEFERYMGMGEKQKEIYKDVVLFKAERLGFRQHAEFLLGVSGKNPEDAKNAMMQVVHASKLTELKMLVRIADKLSAPAGAKTDDIGSMSGQQAYEELFDEKERKLIDKIIKSYPIITSIEKIQNDLGEALKQRAAGVDIKDMDGIQRATLQEIEEGLDAEIGKYRDRVGEQRFMQELKDVKFMNEIAKLEYGAMAGDIARVRDVLLGMIDEKRRKAVEDDEGTTV